MNILEVILQLCSLEEIDTKIPSLALKLWKICCEPQSVRGGGPNLKQARLLQQFVKQYKAISNGENFGKLIKRIEQDI
jgi:hypothetical protein